MGEKELVLSIILINIILFIFIIGIILFVYQYRKRKILHGNELLQVNSDHNKAILLAQLQAQEQTMIHIGNDIHDGVGQKLTLASLYLQKYSLKDNPIIPKDTLIEINDMINEALKELRLLSKTLINPELAQFGLVELINHDIKRINDLNEVLVEFSLSGEAFEMPEITKNNIYRIIQEFLQNSIKHAHSSRISISLNFENRILKVACEDDGIGFLINKSTEGIGVTNIKRRFQEMKAEYDFSSELNRGTYLKFIINLQDE